MSHVSLNELLTFVIKTLLLVSPKFKLELNENPQQLFYFFQNQTADHYLIAGIH